MTAAQIASLIVLALFATGLFVAVFLVVRRTLTYLHMGMRVPRLLWRDLIVKSSFGLSIGSVLVARALVVVGIDVGALNKELWWVLLTGTGALVSVWTFVYYEMFVIEVATNGSVDFAAREEPLEP